MQFDQERRYARQIMLPEIGTAGQEAFLGARVLVIGAGGLGSPLITYLAAAGIGHLGIIDDDRVELSNLARQIVHETGDIGRLKVDSASDRASELNPAIKVTTYPHQLTAENAEAIIAQYDVVADGCDNFGARFIVNAACLKLGKPLVSASMMGFDGQVMTIAPHLDASTACYQCLVNPEARDANTCRESGVIGPLGGIIGSMQALEVLRVLLGTPALVGKLALYNGRTASQRIVTVAKDVECSACGHGHSRANAS